MRGFGSFWWKAFKMAFVESWAWFDHFNNAFGVVAAILYVGFIAQGIAKKGIGGDFAMYIALIPVWLWVLVFIYYFIKAPHSIYEKREREMQQLIAESKAFHDQKPKLIIRDWKPELPYVIKAGLDVFLYKVEIANINPHASAQNVIIHLTIDPPPKDLSHMSFPIHLPSDGRVINPGKSYFRLFTVGLSTLVRYTEIKDENGYPHSFEDDLAALISSEYILQIEVSALDCEVVRRQFKLRFTSDNKCPLLLDPIESENESKKMNNPKPDSPEIELTEDQVKILICLAEQGHPVIGSSIASVTKLSQVMTDYCLNELRMGHYISTPLDIHRNSITYQIDQRGRKYLLDRNLVK